MEWLIAIVLILALLGFAAWLLRGYILGDQATSIFGGSREKRIGVSDVANIDGRRKLMLVYRDGVEHLILTGGPVDMLIEQNIVQQQAARPVAYDRQPAPQQPAPQQPALQQSEPREPAPQAAFGKIRARAAATSLDQ